mmetsp:Transcript_41568/g.65993  ORF Transcript_41568/g.65993 Transcript_41568/m.65993 type:complete len:119 (-) Transcript_41568:90-446(-)
MKCARVLVLLAHSGLDVFATAVTDNLHLRTRRLSQFPRMPSDFDLIPDNVKGPLKVPGDACSSCRQFLESAAASMPALASGASMCHCHTGPCHDGTFGVNMNYCWECSNQKRDFTSCT